VFGLVVLASAVCSMQPLSSLHYVRKYLAPYILVYMVAVESLYSWRHYRIVITTIYLVGIIVTSASVAARYLYLYGEYDLRSDFQRSEIVRVEKTTAGVEEIRNQWPFYHHNRLCSYALMVTFFVWLQFFVTRNWELKTLTAISAVIPVWTMIATLTRGGWIALAVGALALVLMINWRSVWIVLAVMLAAWWVSPTVVRDRMTSILRPPTYTEPGGTFHLRRYLWRCSLDVIRTHPVLGLGAGWTLFEEYVKAHYPLIEPNMETSNAHNNFLEIAAESGIVASVLFLAFMAALFVQISHAWRATRRQTKRRFVVAGFFALLIGINVYGLGSYSLRYTIGMLVWVCFALMTVLPAIVRAIPEEAQPFSAGAGPAGNVT
jgi:O-antigen ligase